MNRFVRVLKHRLIDESDVQRMLGKGTLERLHTRVADSERGHSGEIRLYIEAGLPLSYLWRNATARERAVAMFAKLRVWDTERNNGVLIYLLMAEHAIEIVADRGISRHVSAEHWRSVLGGMAAAFRAGRFEGGLNDAIDAVHALLMQHFPLGEGESNPNELPDAAMLG